MANRGRYRIPLPSQEELRRLFDYQPDTGLLLWRHRPEFDARWNNRFAGKVAGHVTDRGYVQVQVGDHLALAHRVIWKWLHNEEPPEVDHRDTDSSNNRELNLRGSTRSQNLANRKGRPGKTLPKGVQLTAGGRFRAEMHADGKTIHIGNYSTPELASEAFAKAVAERHGEFARSE
jgi:hypothetical protein